jgi:hypothetical protein
MATITGPKIQFNAGRPLVIEGGLVEPNFATFLHSVQQTVHNLTRSGPTTSRPTKTLDGRYIGMDYFDTTLGLKVTLKSVNQDVWVKGDGTAV